MQVAIEAEDLTKYYGQFTAIQGISFAVQTGTVTAFLGPNGAGKSTCMKILTGFLAASSGRARLAGLDVHQQRLEVSRKLGYLPENGPLYKDMTPARFLHFIAEARGIDRPAIKHALERVTDACRLSEVWHKSIGKLSKGFRQRVGLAAAIIHQPEILILDEPTAGLDPNQIILVRELIGSLRKQCTVLLSTHILQEVEAMADHIILISEGRLRFDGSPAEMAAESSLEERFHQLTAGVAT